MDPEQSYQNHQTTYENTACNEKVVSRLKHFPECLTIDDWRENRFLSCIDPILENYPDASWLTVADGYFGTAARYILGKGSKALATDLDVKALDIACQKEWIGLYEKANAENLQYPDNTFDFAFCKEAFHHFPRPAIAFYEMCRVAKFGIVLSEPNDWIPAPFFRKLLSKIKGNLFALVGRRERPHSDEGCYEEPSRNYVYTVSKREITKMAIALDYPVIIYRYLHDYWEPKYNDLSIHSGGMILLKLRIKFAGLLNLLRFNGLNRIQIIILKSSPSNKKLLVKFREAGFKVEFLPKNPYL